MKIHEYQAKAILRQAGVSIPAGAPADNPWQAWKIAQQLKADKFVVKAQIHAGGRGKGGGVKLADSPEQVRDLTGQMLGMTLVTPQTGPAGRLVRRVLVEQAAPIARELYFAVLVDRAARAVVLMASTAGGMEIEELASREPKRIVRVHVDPLTGAGERHGRALAFGLGLDDPVLINQVNDLALKCCRAFMQNDLSLLEINPLAVTAAGGLLALDAKIELDDNALWRHPELAELRDFNEEHELEIHSSSFGVDYVKLDGSIGCMVNGAGLAMATMDMIKLAGAEPANFLDIKGGADVENVINAFKLLSADPHVRVVLINIFGGIVRCDMVAQGILTALQSVQVNAPIVVRIEGTNAEQAARLLDESGFDFITAQGLGDAASKAAAALRPEARR